MHHSKIRIGTMLMVAVILVAGTISMAVPASFAQSYYGQKEYRGYEDSYGNDYEKKNQASYEQQQYKQYEDSYGNDYEKKKSQDLNIQKVKCNNIIVNGIDTTSASSGGIMDGITDENDGAWAEDQWLADDQKELTGIDKNIVNFCKNKNNEEVEFVANGQQGPPGPPGADGQDGAQGPPGPSQINATAQLYRINGNTVTAGTTALPSTANCDPGDVIYAGGESITNGFKNINTKTSVPTSTGTGWEVTILGSAGANTVTFNAVAVCFDNSP